MLPHKPFNIVLLGGPGSGKGTQAALLKKTFGLVHLSTGELLRNEITQRTESGIIAEQLIDHGNYVPDDMILDLLNNHITKENDPSGFIFDGAPRTLRQAEMMDGLNYSPAIPTSIVVNLLIDEQEIINRITNRAILEGRKDDKIEILPQRIANYHALTEPLIEYYRDQKKILQINGMQSIEEVFEDIRKNIRSYFSDSL